MRDHTPEGDRSARRRPRTLVVAFALAVVAAPLVATAATHAGHPPLLRAEGHSRAAQGGAARLEKPQAGVAKRAHLPKPARLGKPKVLYLKKARSVVFDVRKLKSVVVKRERAEDDGPIRDADADVDADAASTDPDAASTDPDAASTDPDAAPASAGDSAASPSAPAPGPDSSFDGLDFANWGAGHPPDTNGDVGPTYYIQTINSSIGIFDKSTHARVAAFTFDAFMSQGQFGNLCDTDNFGDPVVLYDSYEDRWFITDFAFKLDAGGNVNPQTVYQCFAVSKTGDPVNGGWNFYSILDPGGLGDYPKFGVWPDGIYMSANMFGYSATSSYIAPHVWALNKEQMYAGAPTVQVVDFAGPSDDFTLLPANSRLQDGSPPAGSSEYFVSTEQFLNALSIYKLHVDWDKVSTSTFTGPSTQLAPNCWPNATPANASTTANSADVLAIRAMAQAQYTNQGGAESVWVDHTVNRGTFTTATCGGTNTNNATVRWYQANVTGGTVAANVVQGATYDPEAANTFFRYVPSLAVDRAGDLAIDYTKSNSTTNPQIKYAGRLAGDPLNTLGQGEQTLIDGTGSQSGNCGGSPCTRWGDYSGMALDPNGCEFWTTGEYFATTGLNHQTRIGSFHYPSCTTVGNGTLSGTVTDGTNPIAGAVVTLGSRTTTTNGSGSYSFSVPAGTYPTETAEKPGFDPGTASTLVVPDGGTLTRNFTLTAAPQTGCFVDDSQTAFQRGVPANCDLTSSPGNVVLASPDNTAAQNSNVNPTGFGFNNTSWAGQTFTPTVTGQLKRIDVELFCSGCSGTNPDITVSIRNTTTGSNPVPTGSDLVSATLPGFNDGAAGGLKTVTFPSPITLTAGTRYAFIFRATAARTGTYAYTCSCSAPGFSNSNPYPGGQFVTSSTSGSSWTADTTTGGRDLNFVTYISGGFTPTGTLVSSLKDANPTAGSTAHWTTLSWAANTPAGTAVKFQVAASNSPDGPFNFVGPDGTAGTFFTTSGASLSQFDGMRYLKYKAFLSTSSSSVTPSISSVSACFNDTTGATSATTLAVNAASGTFGGTTNLSATLTSNGNPVANKSVSFTLNGSSAGSAQTNAGGVATISGASLSGIGAGSYPAGVGASFAGDGSFDPSSGSAALTVNKASQAISVTTHAPGSAVYNTSFSVAATGGGSGNPVTFSSSGGCNNTGATFTMTSGTTTCSVKYDQAGNANYNAAPTVTETVTAVKAAQSISVTTHAPSSAVFGSQFTVAANGGGSGNAVTFSSSGGCSNTGATFSMTSGTTACSVKYDQAGNANYSAAPTVTETVTATKAAQAITVTTHAPGSAVYNTSFSVAATGGGSGNAVTFSSAGSCSNTGADFTMTSGTGTCSVKYDQAGNANYSAAPTVTETVTASKASQAITVTTHAPGSAVYNTGFSVAATGGGSANPVTFSSSGGCNNTGAAFTMTSGTTACSVKYDQAGNANYSAAPTVTETVTAQKADQSISVTTPAPSTAVYGTSFSVAATAVAGLVSFSSDGVCVNIGDTFTMGSGTGTCTVKFDQAGDNDYNAASEVTESVTAVKAGQSITVTTHAPPSAADGSQFTVAATGGGSGNPVTFSSSGGCSNTGATFTMTSGTTACSVMYDQAGDDNYSDAPEVTETVNAGPDAQAITVTTHAPPSAVYGSQFTVAATGGGSGNPVTFSSSGGCSNAGATFTMTSGTTACTVKYDQAGNADYSAAPTVTETVNAVRAGQSIRVTAHAPKSAVYNTGFSVAATGGASGNAVTFSSAGACSNSGASFTMTSGTGSCSVRYDQAGDANYSAAPTVTETVTAVKAAQSITVTTHAPAKATSGSQFTVAATAPGGAIAYSSAGACTNSGPTFTMTSAKGTCTVKYDQAGNSNYKAAPEVSEKVKAAAAFGGFRAPAPGSSRNRPGSKIAVRFTLRDASGHPLTSAEAAALAAAGGVKVVLSRPGTRSRTLASARCSWVGKSRVFKCSLKTPSGLKTGKATRYSLTALQNVDGRFVPIPPAAATAAAANPETIFFKKKRRHH